MRIAATESLPYLLECAKIRGEEYVATMWGTYICPNLLKAIEIEPEQSVLPEYLASFARVRTAHQNVFVYIVPHWFSQSEAMCFLASVILLCEA